MPTQDYYDTLGVARDASADEIRAAYRALARKHHPDVAKDKAVAETHFRTINEAYEVLSDPNKRAQYDRFGTVGNGQGSPFGDAGFASAGFGDIFDMFFGEMRNGGQQQRRSGPQRGSDLRYDLEITLEDAFSGTTREIVYSHLAQCETCKGSGAEPGSLLVSCERCSGSGTMRTVRQTPLGQFVTQSVCTACGGEGERVPHPCQVCAGRGRVEVERKLSVKVPPGVDDGSRIRISGSGESGMRGGSAGDLYVYLNIAAHERFSRDGNVIGIDVPIPFTLAAMGGPLTVPSLEGPLEVHVPSGTQSQSVLRLRGKGMPNIRGGQRGDQLVTLHVVVPSKLSRRQKELLEEFSRAGGDEIEEKGFFERVREAFRPE